jgi:hypothetical protein
MHKFWRWFTTPHILAEWKWEGNKLTDLPRAAWCDFRRTIRGPILKVLIGDDLVIVGDIYCSIENQSSPLIQVPRDKHAEIIGTLAVYDGPTTIVPRGCNPEVCD